MARSNKAKVNKEQAIGKIRERDTVAFRLVFLLDPFNSTVESEADDTPEQPSSPDNGPCQTGDTHTEGEWGGEENQNLMTDGHRDEELKSWSRAPRSKLRLISSLDQVLPYVPSPVLACRLILSFQELSPNISLSQETSYEALL